MGWLLVAASWAALRSPFHRIEHTRQRAAMKWRAGDRRPGQHTMQHGWDRCCGGWLWTSVTIVDQLQFSSACTEQHTQAASLTAGPSGRYTASSPVQPLP